MKRAIQILLVILTLLFTAPIAFATESNINVKYRAHVSNKGWLNPLVELGKPIGTTGENRSLECIEFKTENLPFGLKLKARGYVTNKGWQDYIENDGQIGTVGQKLPLEAIELQFESIVGVDPNYDIYYRVHSSKVGWLGWAKNGETAGTTDFALPIESVETMVVPAGTGNFNNSKEPYLSQDQIDDLNFEFNLECSNGETQSNNYSIVSFNNNITFNGLSAQLDSPGSSIAYQAYCSNIGWSGWKQDGEISGDNPIEAVQFELRGKLADKYEIYYQVSIPYYGWNDWTYNGRFAGTMKGKLPINGLRVKILPKKVPIQGNTYRAFFEVPNSQYFKGRGIMVSIPLQLVFLQDENNKIIFISDCTTGKPGTDKASPTGKFKIIKKSRKEVLTGPDYEFHVDYWIPFDGIQYGFHDANWRKDNEYGRNVYTYNGSHGCINMRLREIALFNKLVNPGDLVVIH